MCPLCIGTATLLVSSGTSAGGLAALLFRRHAGKKGALAAAAAPPGLPGLDRDPDRPPQALASLSCP